MRRKQWPLPRLDLLLLLRRRQHLRLRMISTVRGHRPA